MGNPVSWSEDLLKRLNKIIWHTPLSEISKGKVFLSRQLRIFILAARGFLNDNVMLRASALTFYTLLSVIPIAAIAFAIAKGFGLDENLEKLIIDEFHAHEEVMKWLLNNARSALEETKGGYIAGVGIVILFWSVMSLLGQIEGSFNHIWQIRSSRPWSRKFTDYITIMLVAPVFIILTSSISLFVSTQLTNYMFNAPILDFFKPVISFLVKLAPYFLTWLALTILFMIMPNVKVRLGPAFISAIIAGTILQILQYVYIDLQFGITKLSTIYGTFAAVPLFIIWLQSSWIIVLLGAELSFANQNIARYEYESDALNITNYQKKALVLLIMNLIISNFATGEKPVSAETIARSLKISIRLVADILQDLVSVNLISIIHENEHKERLFQPSMDINRITVSYVFSCLDKRDSAHTIAIKSKEYDRIISMLDKFDRLIVKSDSNILIKDI